ncbi:MAG: hypothetical protein ACF8R7_06530 [Phycisphaerales bacterium JB039]
MFRTLAIALALAALTACGESTAPEPTPEQPTSPPAQPAQQPTAPATGGSDPVKEAEDAAKKAAEDVQETVEQTRQEAEKKVEEVSQAARQTMDKYLADLGSLGDLLGGVTSQFSAASATPKARSLIENLEGYVAELEKLAPDQLAQLKGMYEAQLKPLVDKVQAEVQRITSSDSLSALAPLLQDLPLLGG